MSKSYSYIGDKRSEFKLKDKYQSAGKNELPGSTNDQKEDTENERQKSSKNENLQQQKQSNLNEEKETVEDPNELGAKLMRAELMGDEELVKSLKARLEVAREKTAAKKTTTTTPANNSNNNHGFKNKSRQNKHSSGGNSQVADIDFEQANMLKRNYHGDEYDDFGQVKQKKNKKNHKRNNSSEQKSGNDTFGADASSHSKRLINTNDESLVENCEYCFENVHRHLVVSMGKYSYLCLPSMESLVDGNCLIVPMSHQSSSVTCDEEVWSEIQDFKKTLVRMFELKKSDCVFYEQYSMGKKFSHMVIECVPLGRNVSNVAPGYFKKALVESESEFKAQNRQLIKTQHMGVRSAIPRNMPYFAVSFGLDEGFAHIIENDEAFPAHFAKEVIGGILDLDPMIWRRPKKDDFTTQSKKVLEFIKWWKPFEFNTKMS